MLFLTIDLHISIFESIAAVSNRQIMAHFFKYMSVCRPEMAVSAIVNTFDKLMMWELQLEILLIILVDEQFTSKHHSKIDLFRIHQETPHGKLSQQQSRPR